MKGKGGWGFGYTNVQTTIPTSRSFYLRKKFTIQDYTKIASAVLLSDYDASFVAYINGYEFRRRNIGSAWNEPAHTDVADLERKAGLIDGKPYEDYILKDYQLNNWLKNGDNVLAIQVHASSTSPTKIAGFFNLLFAMKDTDKQFAPAPAWFKPPPMFAEYATLPIVRITSPRLNDSLKISGKMEITCYGKGKKHYFDEMPNHYNGDIIIKNRGNSTLEFPKKSWRLETQDSLGNNLNLSLFGFPAENDWILYAPYTDKSLLRNYLMYDIARNMLEWAPRTQLCEVFHNGYYMGVYVFTEKIKRDNDRVDIRKLRQIDTIGNFISDGYMTKVDWQYGPDPAVFTHGHKTSYPYYSDITVEHAEPEVDSLHPKQKKYIEDFYFNFQENLQSDGYASKDNGYSKFINTASFVDYMILNEISKDIESYRYSTYFYKNHVLDDDLVHLGPAWDYNLGFGNVDFGTEGAQFTKKWLYNKEGNRIWWFVRLLEEPDYAEQFNCRWSYYKQKSGVISTAFQFGVIDSAIAEMGEAVTRNHYHWETLGRYVWPNFFVGETYEEEKNYLKTWIDERIAWIDINVPGDCNIPLYAQNIEGFNDKGIKLFPTPTRSNFTIACEQKMSAINVIIINGRSVYSDSNISSYKQEINPNNDLAPGVYFVQVQLENGIQIVEKLVKH